METVFVILLIVASYVSIRLAHAARARLALFEQLDNYQNWTRSEKYKNWAGGIIAFWDLDRHAVHEDWTALWSKTDVRKKYLSFASHWLSADYHEEALASFDRFTAKG